jgi:DNA-binding NtrC family response regulator
MIKAGQKPTRLAPRSEGKVLYCENDAKVLAAQSAMFENAGYAVERAQGRAAAEQALRKGTYDIVVLGHTLTKDDRHHLPYMAKKGKEETQVLVLHASGKHYAVDLAIDSRDGEKAVLEALKTLAEHKLAVVV